MKVVIIGPAHPLRGGLASFDERLTRAFTQQGMKASIYTFSLQYPSFLFPGTTQFSTEPKPADLDINVCINSVNPINWIRMGNELRKARPDMIVVRYWMPFMGPCLGTILRYVQKNRHTKIICIADNIIPHEQKFIDKPFTRYFVKSIDAFITMSDKVMTDLRLFTDKPAVKVIHPLYDNFGDEVPKDIARKHVNINPNKKTIVFFGFIRNYKGLDLLYEALAILKQHAHDFYTSLQVVVAGEYYEDKEKYTSLISKYSLGDVVIEKTQFIADSEVKYYICCADVLIQPYRSATQSGVTPLAYHFNKPMIVTNVGALPSNVPHGKVGLVCEPTPQSIADSIKQYFDMDQQALLSHILEEKKKYSWKALVDSILSLSHDCKK